jgi:mxaJ protein
MFSHCLRIPAALAVLLLPAPATAQTCAPPPRELRVCSDPHNLPYSNQRREGFENRIADLVARELKATVRYVWWESPRGFIRNTLNAGQCDVVMGVPSHLDATLNTAPYYRSSYVFVYRKDRGLNIRSLDDPALRQVKIGLQLIGDESTPAAEALAHRKIIDNVVGFTVIKDGSDNNPAAKVVDAVGSGQVDLTIVWGPSAGFFAKRQPMELALVPVNPPAEHGLPFVFDIAMGVRKGDDAFRQELQQVLDRKRKEIGDILDTYGVPRLEMPS